MLTDSDFAYLQGYRRELAAKYHKVSSEDIFQDALCVQEYRLEVRKVQSHIPAKYRRLTLDDITHPQLKVSKEYIQDYISNLEENRKQGVAPFLVGPCGTGKSLLGTIILTEALRRGFTAQFSKLDECIDLLTSSWYDDELKQEFNQQILSVDFLMIDDLGIEMRSLTSNLVESTLSKILRVRADNLRPTILTSNLDPNNFKTNYDGRIYSIIKEHALIVPCNGVDYREQILAPKINPK